MRDETKRNLRVGALTVAALVLLSVAVLTIGKRQQIFIRHTRYHTSFSNVTGLQTGAPVALDGASIGFVEGGLEDCRQTHQLACLCDPSSYREGLLQRLDDTGTSNDRQRGATDLDTWRQLEGFEGHTISLARVGRSLSATRAGSCRRSRSPRAALI